MRTELYMRIGPTGMTFEYVLKKFVIDLPVMNKGQLLDEGEVLESSVTTKFGEPTQEVRIDYKGHGMREDVEKIKNRFIQFYSYEEYFNGNEKVKHNV